jgi:cobalt/nickel transport protein
VIGSVFSYAIPKAGWWGFAALNEASWTLKDPSGKEKPIEIGAVYWVRTRDMK